jgi:hypothetical protein
MPFAIRSCPRCGAEIPLYWWDLLPHNVWYPTTCGKCAQTSYRAFGRSTVALLAGGVVGFVGMIGLRATFGHHNWLEIVAVLVGFGLVSPLVEARIARLVKRPRQDAAQSR